MSDILAVIEADGSSLTTPQTETGRLIMGPFCEIRYTNGDDTDVWLPPNLALFKSKGAQVTIQDKRQLGPQVPIDEKT